MSNFENKEWNEHAMLLRMYYELFYKYDTGYTLKQKEKFTKERTSAIQEIKRIQEWPPFAKIALETTGSSYGFDECYDNIDWGMEQTVRNILNKQIEG